MPNAALTLLLCKACQAEFESPVCDRDAFLAKCDGPSASSVGYYSVTKGPKGNWIDYEGPDRIRWCCHVEDILSAFFPLQ